MMMVELTSVPSAALPLAALTDHLRLSSGFADDGSQEAVMVACLRAAMAAIEARIGKALLRRQLALTLTEWQGGEAQGLPIAPVSAIDSVTLVARNGDETVVDASRYALRADAHRPRIEAVAGLLPAPVLGGSIEVVLTAGYGADWVGVPADLQQAMLGLAAEFYANDAASPRRFPPLVSALIEPYRLIRLRGGVA